MAVDLTCIYNASSIGAIGTCMDILSGSVLWSSIFISLLFLFVIGFGLVHRIQVGMMFGGFMMSLIGLGMMALGYIAVYTLMISVVVCMAGIFITYVTRKTL